MHLVSKAAVVICCGILTASATGVVAAETVTSRTVGSRQSTAAAAQDGGGRTFQATTETAAGETTLVLALDAAPGGGPLELSAAERRQIADVLGVPLRELASASPGEKAPKVTALSRKGPATLRCDKNPSWTDARGTLSARFNCHHNTINWGYKISAKARAIISGKVTEQGVSWWNSGKRKPKNAGHVVGKSYHFHGTLKPVKHRDHVQFQDYMTFRVNVGGKTGTGSLAWAANLMAKK